MLEGDPDPDPGGHKNSKGLSPQELSDLKDQNEQQLLLIAQLKEMLRKEQSSVTHEKVEEYVNTLSKAKAKKSRIKRDDSGASESGRTASSASIDASKKERVILLRQQLEENKAKLAERSKSQKGIEKMVTQLQAQLKDSQQYASSLNVSLSETKTIDYNENTSQKELYNILLTKEKKIAELTVKAQKLEGNVLDLQENLKEKDSVIEARTKAITLMTDSLSKKGKNTLDALEETKEQMRKMQENFVTLEAEMKARQLSLLNDLKMKNFEIADLEKVIKQLEEENAELRVPQLPSKTAELTSEIDNKKYQELKQENTSLLEKISELERDLVESQKQKELGDAQIQLLTEDNEKLSKANVENLQKISELEKQLKEALSDLNLLRSTSNVKETDKVEIEKLKKQLEESNKSMIKMRAQQKSKLKELNKRLDQFKKMSDANSLIAQLQNENTKLSEKIAELEEEKGNMQLKMVESTGSSKDSSELEDAVKSLEETISRIKEEVIEKDKVVEILESEVLSLKKELNQKNEEFSTQVSSEISSIHYEEQLEKVEAENNKIVEEMAILKQERDNLLDKIEILTTEKQELNSKLENYIQENIELIDKLEKLSAEKVSSAESIEIVEGLTQQEKLELAAYQKSINPEETLKCAEDDNSEPPVELNESVLQLSEDTAELLQKIEMFTQERKEVMQKMEALKEENNSLNIKIKEIESNRDVLEETYEQLQNDKEILANEKQELLLKLENISDAQKLREDLGKSEESLQLKLEDLQNQCQNLIGENGELKRTLKDLNLQMQEKYDLENILIKMEKQNSDLELKLQTTIEEANKYQQTIRENKNEIINSSELIVNLESKLSEREKEIDELKSAVNDLNTVINELQSKNNDYEVMLSELERLKSALNNEIEQARNYEAELNQNGEVIGELNGELVAMNRKILESQNEIEIKDNEIEKLKKELASKEEFITNLQSSIEEKDKHFRTVTGDIKDKCLGLQEQLNNNSDSLRKQVEELNIKNKEQLDKMKKIAANLKKKTQSYQELQDRYTNEKEKWEIEAKEKDEIVSECEKRLEMLQQRLQSEINRKEEMNIEINTLRARILDLDQNNVDLQNYILELKRNDENVQKLNLQQEMSASLHEEIQQGNVSQTIQEEKIRELEMLLETKEHELVVHKNRLDKLETHIKNLEEEKLTLEVTNVGLEEQLNLNLQKVVLQDQLELKLTEVCDDNKVIGKQLEETVAELENLKKKHGDNEELVKKLKIKLKKAHDKVNELKSTESNAEQLQTVNEELKKHIAALELNQKHIQNENETLQKRNMSDYEKIEADYQIQLEELLRAKNELTVECEKLQEKLKQVQDKEEEFIMEIEEYKIRLQENDSANSDEINKLREELELAGVKLHESIKKIEQLNTEIDVLKEEIEVLKRAKKMRLDEITQQSKVTVSTQTSPKVEDSQNIPTFNWFSQGDTNNDDVFGSLASQQGPSGVNPKGDAGEPSVSQNINWLSEKNSEIVSSTPQNQGTNYALSAVVENSNEALVKKIKALEFLLYNVDKENEEKEDAMSQCAELVTELTNLFYEKANAKQNCGSTLDSQISNDTNQEAQKLSAVESQILSPEQIKQNEDKGVLHKIEFAEVAEQKQPAIEPLVQPKQAYLCQAKDTLEAFEENDDGWGWAPEEEQNVQDAPQVTSLQLEIQQLRENLKILQVERENHLEEIRQLQIKSGKLIKKCKELKAKCQPPRQQVDFDLNETIQEELKNQVQQLEKKIKEVVNELGKEKSEKKELLKKIDVLTTAHERMIEMKEIQDSDLLRWQRKHQEAMEKLQQYEWGTDGFTETKKLPVNIENPDNSKIEDLEKTIKDLTLDNEELQALLEEQSILRSEAEKSRNLLLSSDKDQELSKLREINEHLRSEIEELKNQNKDKEELVTEKCVKDSLIQKLEKEIAIFQEQISGLHSLLQEKEVAISNMQTIIEQLNCEKAKQNEHIEKLTEDIEAKAKLEKVLAERVDSLEQQIRERETIINELKLSLNELKNAQSLWEATETKLNNLITQREHELATVLSEKERKDLENQKLLEHLQTSTKDNEQTHGLLEQLQDKDKEIADLIVQKELKDQEYQKVFDDLDILKKSITDKDREILNLQKTLDNKDSEFEEKMNNIITELNVNWQAQVDQRGEDIAERWKTHLELVQKDFHSLQEQLSSNIAELEERCKVLVNENNELRKNVDAEVDKISALQQQQIIASLNAALEEKQAQIEKLQNNLPDFTSIESELNNLRTDIAEKDKKLSSINIIIETTQRQFDEKREVVDEIVSILEKHSNSPLSYEKQDIVNEFQRQLGLLNDKEREITKLRNELQDINAQKDREIVGLNQIIEDLEKEVSLLHERDAEIVRLNTSIENIVREKEGVEQELIKIQQEYSNLQITLHDCKQKCDNVTQQNAMLVEDLKAKDQHLNMLNDQLIQTQHTNDSNKEVERLNCEIAQGKQDYDILQQHLTEYQTKLGTIQQQLDQKSQEMESVIQQLGYYQQNIKLKDDDIEMLQKSLAEKEIEYNNTLEQHLQIKQHCEELMSSVQQNQQVQHQYEVLLSEKDTLITNLQGQVQNLHESNQSYLEKSNQADFLIKELEEKLLEQTSLVDEDTKQLKELQSIIEDQAAKIEDLKKQLLDMSNQYDNAISEMDLRRPSPVTQQPSSSAVENQPIPRKTPTYGDDASEPVNRAELDIALYMLHQRDVRCEELTVELTQLLEERDTLQLRLSNAIREKEELRRRLIPAGSSTLHEQGSSTPKSKSSEIFLAASGTELAKEPLETDMHLASKLSELKNIGYKKDKTFVDEQEMRRRQQLAIMQQHINEASKLPPEAAAKLVDASYTLSRDVQSPSKVLLNWLWGNSTPKANES